MPEPALGLAPAVALSLALAAGAVIVLGVCAARLPMARPTPRSLHARPVPRVAGLAIWAGFLPVALVDPPIPGLPTPAWLAPWFAVAAVSLVDDWRGVGAAVRLAIHGAAGAGVALTLLGTPAAAGIPVWLASVAAVVLLIAWSANLFNFMDGSDGLAALTAVCGFAAYGIAAWRANEPATVYAALAAAVVPVLAVNLPPARAFMGDVGAVPLGFLAATFGIAGCRNGTWPAWFPPLVFLPFVADASVTLLRRLLGGAQVLEAHRTHYYQRLHQLGAGHAGTLAVYGVLVAGTSATAVAALAVVPGAGEWALGAWIAVLAAVFAAIDYHWKRSRSPP
jgi:UDP-N-acetylmuramyl pentapeptide phosphotransferase/UDP-N-acetylglucosamine-1-phosphate transferase